ncbi:MAG: hypothetical protein M1816_007856 [Peltula sp. TS41687]|nr:MAG: hypothetical protein M1816_007856 [Peltula sp. TS41687]
MDQSTPPTSDSVGPSSASNTNKPSTTTNYAFLVHSQDTLPRNLPPTVDNKPLARQKRRRTSPEDQAILEEEYQRNPKPDKAARMNIVNRVALGEKEVQIWFQNRRQNTRRRAKPLSPHELLNPKIDPVSSHDTDEPTTAPMAVVTPRPSDPSSFAGHRNDGTESCLQPKNNAKLHGAKPGPIGNEVYSQAATSFETSQSSHVDIGSLMASSQDSINTLATEVSGQSDKDAHRTGGKPIMQAPAYISNRRGSSYNPVNFKPNSDKSYLQSEVARKPSVPSDITFQTSGSRATSTLPRLRLSVDGKAQLVTEDDAIDVWAKTIQPAHYFQRDHGLQRSQSALYPGHRITSDANVPLPSWTRRSGLNRSKPSQPWELYCDDDAKDGNKTEQTQFDTQTRAGSDTTLLRPNRNKRNAQTMTSEPPSKRVKTNADVGGPKSKKPSLVRSNSSFPRLQTRSTGSKERPKKTKTNSTKAGPAALGSLSGGDSDKENWAPDDDVQANGRRPTTVPHDGRIGSQGRQGTSQVDAMVTEEDGGSSERKPAKSTTNHGESASLSGEHGKQLSVGVVSESLDTSYMSRNEEDLACVQNLLSLSQGNWR